LVSVILYARAIKDLQFPNSHPFGVSVFAGSLPVEHGPAQVGHVGRGRLHVEVQRLLWVVVSSAGDGWLGGAELPGVSGLVHAARSHHQLPYLAFGTVVRDEGLRDQIDTVILAIKSKGISAEIIIRHVRV